MSGVFTICESFLLGGVAGYYDQKNVLIAIGITSAVFFALTMFAMQTR